MELGVVIANNTKILNGFIYYGEIEASRDFYWGREKAHGMDYSFLKKHGWSQRRLGNALRGLICDFSVTEVVGFGSDIQELLNRLTLNIPYRNVSLPIWKERVLKEYHKVAEDAKRGEVPVAGCRCRWRTVHPFPITPKQEENRAGGAHCALYDALEVCLADTNIHFM